MPCKFGFLGPVVLLESLRVMSQIFEGVLELLICAFVE
jgi:hypothetical protein